MSTILALLLAGACKPENQIDPTDGCDLAVDAGADQTIVLGRTVELDASASENCDEARFVWAFDAVPTGSAVNDQSLSSNEAIDAFQPSFTPDIAGTYVLSLVLAEGASNSPADVVVIDVTPGDQAPVADCGGDLDDAIAGERATLDGTGSYDPEGQDLTYHWTLSAAPSCSALGSDGLFDATTALASILPDCGGTYVAALVVSDGDQWSDPDYCVVQATSDNVRPVADAGFGGAVPPCDGDEISLNGWASYDDDGDDITYMWSLVTKPTGSAATDAWFDDRTLVEPTFTWDVEGDYTFQLQVHDGQLESAPDLVTYTAGGIASNHAPIANAGDDVEVDVEDICMYSYTTYTYQCDQCEEEVAYIDGTASMDPDGDALAYTWSTQDGIEILSPYSAVAGIVLPAHPSTLSSTYRTTFDFVLEVADCANSSTDVLEVEYSCTGSYPW